MRVLIKGLHEHHDLGPFVRENRENFIPSMPEKMFQALTSEDADAGTDAQDAYHDLIDNYRIKLEGTEYSLMYFDNDHNLYAVTQKVEEFCKLYKDNEDFQKIIDAIEENEGSFKSLARRFELRTLRVYFSGEDLMNSCWSASLKREVFRLRGTIYSRGSLHVYLGEE